MSTISSASPPVVVGVNGTRAGLIAVDLAAAEAALRHAPLLIVHAWPGRYGWPPRGPTSAVTEGAGRDLLSVAAGRAASDSPGLRIGTELVDGPAAEVLARFSRQAEMLVIGHRDGQLRRADWGTTAARLAHGCGCPLLVHRGRVPHPGPVVVAVSGRTTPSLTLAFAFREAALWNARLVAVHLCDRALVTTGSTVARARSPEQRLADVLAGTRWTFRQVSVDQMVVPVADMAYTIDRAAYRARMLVAGAGHDGRIATLINVRVRPASTRRGLCPVALVPSEEGTS